MPMCDDGAESDGVTHPHAGLLCAKPYTLEKRGHPELSREQGVASSFILAESLLNQKFERMERLGPLSPGSSHRNFGALTGRKHHQTHNRVAADGFVAPADAHIDVKLFHRCR